MRNCASRNKCDPRLWSNHSHLIVILEMGLALRQQMGLVKVSWKRLISSRKKNGQRSSVSGGGAKRWLWLTHRSNSVPLMCCWIIRQKCIQILRGFVGNREALWRELLVCTFQAKTKAAKPRASAKRVMGESAKRVMGESEKGDKRRRWSKR